MGWKDEQTHRQPPETAPAYQSKPKKRSFWQKVKEAGKGALHTGAKGARYVGGKLKEGSRSSTARKAKEGGKYVARKTARGVASGTRFVGHEVKQNIKRVAKKKIRRGIDRLTGESKVYRYDSYGNPIRNSRRSRRP